MVGLAVFLGANSTPLRSFAQVEGDAWKLPAAAFRNVLSNGASALAQELHRYTQALFVQLSMSVACNRLHSLEKRCARWLLTTMDRVGADCFKLSHDFLAQMLGLRRAGTNAVLQKFKRRGILDYHNGEMNIKNRSSLESAACECYFIITKEYRRLTRV
jgi:CRP-like cAMP-binding protein